MNKLSFLITLLILIMNQVLHAQYKQRAKHGYLQTETIIQDIKDPENNRTIVEKIDKKGRLVQLKEFNELGKKTKDLAFSFSKNEKTCLHYDSRDSLKLKEHWVYDKKHRIIEYSEYDVRKKIENKTTFQYNKWGEKEFELVYKNQELVKRRIFTYNSEGMLIEQKTENAEGKLTYQKNWNFQP